MNVNSLSDEAVNSEKNFSQLTEYAKLVSEKCSIMMVEESRDENEIISTPLDEVLEGFAFKATNMKENAGTY